MIDGLTLAQEAQRTARRSMSEADRFVHDAFPEYAAELQAQLIAAFAQASADDEIAASLRMQAAETAEAARVISRSNWAVESSVSSGLNLVSQAIEGTVEGLTAGGIGDEHLPDEGGG